MSFEIEGIESKPKRTHASHHLPMQIPLKRPSAPDTDVAIPTLMPDDRDRYCVLKPIHRGGMGEILLAELRGRGGFHRKVVLKGLLDAFDHHDPNFKMFMREAQLMALLEHPNIVRVLDLAKLDDRPFLAMEYVRGRNFHQIGQRARVQNKTIPVSFTLRVLSEALRGLHHAHNLTDENGQRLGIVHRDVTPGNLLVSFFGEVKVTDFGIAKRADSPRYTQPQSVRGKARYIAPEQVKGEDATVLSDVYSAGVTLAESLLGEPLWERESIQETLIAIVKEPRDHTIERVVRAHPNVPGLQATLRGALSVNPTNRFASALQFAETLEAISDALGPRMTPVDMGLFVRELFSDAEDLPRNDGFGPSGFPVPKFRTPEEDDSTLVQFGKMPPLPPAPPSKTDGIPPHLPDARRLRNTSTSVIPVQPMAVSSEPTDPNDDFDEDTRRMGDLFSSGPSVTPGAAHDAVVTILEAPSHPASLDDLLDDPRAPQAPVSTRPEAPEPLFLTEPMSPVGPNTHRWAGALIMATLFLTSIIFALVWPG